ncbi:MAG TPA: hypothetical protein VEC38_03565 [Candidatus Binataceae bacterium]|nr:hypothetical protein [Candidatus Binataceae bacterium]
MLRPTANERLMGLQRTIMETLVPELTSPYAQTQAMVMMGALAFAASTLEAAPAYDTGEIKDLAATLSAIKRLSARHIPRRSELARALKRATAKAPAPRGEMEAAMAAFVTALALGKLDGPVARQVRGYVRRNLERMRTLLARLPLG